MGKSKHEIISPKWSYYSWWSYKIIKCYKISRYCVFSRIEYRSNDSWRWCYIIGWWSSDNRDIVYLFLDFLFSFIYKSSDKNIWAFTFIDLWCPGGDLNPHTRRHTHLKRTCLPFHHLGIICGAPSRVRTYNQRFRRPLLFQLSYGCMFPYSECLRIIVKR